MQLNSEEKEALAGLKKHAGYKVLEKIEKQARDDLGALLLTSDLSNKKDLDIIKKNQLYIKARRDFLENVENHVQKIYTPEV